MKKVFLGLLVAGTMMSFTTLNAEINEELDEFGRECSTTKKSYTYPIYDASGNQVGTGTTTVYTTHCWDVAEQ